MTKVAANMFQSAFASAETSPGFMLWQVTNLWQRRQREALAPLGLTHVQFVLLAGLSHLARQDESVTQIKLAQHVQTDEMMTSQVVRALEGKGLVERVPHPTDARAKALRVTNEGAALVNEAVRHVEAVDATFFAVLDTRTPEFSEMLHQLATASR